VECLRLRSGVVFWNNCIFLISSSVVDWLAKYFVSVGECPYVCVEFMVITTDFCMFWRSFCFFLAGEKYGSDSQIRPNLTRPQWQLQTRRLGGTLSGPHSRNRKIFARFLFLEKDAHKLSETGRSSENVLGEFGECGRRFHLWHNWLGLWHTCQKLDNRWINLLRR